MSNPKITNLLVSMEFTFSCGIYFFTQPILDVSLAYYQNIEQARRKPSLKFLYRLTGLGFSIDSALSKQTECRENLVEEIGKRTRRLIAT